MEDKELWQRIQRRFGDGTHASIRSIAAEFNVPDSTIRRKAEKQRWTRDELRMALDVLRHQFDVCVRAVEREIARRAAYPLAPSDYQNWRLPEGGNDGE